MSHFRPFFVLLLPALGAAGIFDAPELKVAPSLTQARQIHLAAGIRVIDTDVSPAGPAVALLLQNASGAQEIQFWNLDQAQPAKVWDVPTGLTARSLAFHPLGDSLFLVATQAQQFVIVKVEKKSGAWTSRQIYTSRQEIRRLVPGPRPYAIGFDEARHENIQAYRVFFGLKANDGHYSIHSITDDGKRDYQVIGHKADFTQFKDADGGAPSEIVASSALPVGFHPAGHLLLWEEDKRCFQSAAYARDHWSKSAKLFGRDVCGGTIAATPNGAGIIHWVSGKDGVDVLLQHGPAQTHEAAGYQLVSAPSSVPDGRGIVGVTKTDAGLTVNYVPIYVPLPDVVNAWMYLQSAYDGQLLAKNGGLFRDLGKQDQLYSLYDSENYLCGGFDESTPTRPYLVTTDSFWELFAAHYEGIFTVRERQVSMPAFWQFVSKAYTSLRQGHPQSQWTAAFGALNALQGNAAGNEEATRILSATGPVASPVLKATFNYGELKPRGHYVSSEPSQRYFRAFRYLTSLSRLNWATDDLRQLPPDVKTAAMRWIASYQDMIAPSRSPLLWQDKPTPAPQYVKHPQSAPVLFPLSWGYDNEIMFSTVFHQDLPPNERIDGPSGARVMPSSLDIAAALGSRFARDLLAPEIAKYPPLN